MTNCSSESFKQALDTFLKTIPDEPQTPGYTCMRRAESNSLIHMTPLTTARHPSISEELHTMPQARGNTHGHLGTEPGNHRKVSTSKCIVLYCIVLYCIVLYRIVSYRMVWYGMVSHRIASHRIASHRIASYRIVSYRIVLYCIVLYSRYV